MALQFGKYEILGLIGSGGMGSVYLARDVVLDRRIALKVLEKQLQDDPQVVGRFLHEARVSAGLAHPNIVVLHDFGKEGSVPFIAMEYLDGENLKTYIEQAFPLTLGQKLHVALQVARGLEFAHARSIVHRDVKPGNIQILPTGDVKLMDFGIAKVASMDLTQTGMMIGTPGYASPEQAQSHPITPASDVFSFGVVLHELLCGRKPFNADNPMSLLFKIVFSEPEPFRPEDGVPPPLEEMVRSCLAKPLASRFPSMAPVFQRLRQIHKTLLSSPDGEDGSWLPGRHDIQPIPTDALMRNLGLNAASRPVSEAASPPAVASSSGVDANTIELAPASGTSGLASHVAAGPASNASTPPGQKVGAPPPPDSPAMTLFPLPAVAAQAPAGSPPAAPWAWSGIPTPPQAPGATEAPLPGSSSDMVPIAPPVVPEVVSKFFGAPVAFEMERLVQGEMARTEFDFFNVEIRRVAKSIGHVNSAGRAFEWTEVDREGNRLFGARISPRAGLTSVRVEENFQPSARILFGGFLGGLGGVGLGVAMAIGMGLFHSVALAALLWVQFVGLAYLLARYFFTGRVRARSFALNQLLERLAEHVERTALPAGTPGNAPYRANRLRARS